MKKKTVITTEKREVWVIREGTSEAEQSIDIGKVIPSTVEESEPDPETENRERNNELCSSKTSAAC